MYYPCSENKVTDQLRGNHVFVFAYADCWFSHEEAQLCLKECNLHALSQKFDEDYS